MVGGGEAVIPPKGVDSMLKSEFTLGGDASLAAGPKSLHEGIGTDGRFKAEIFSYAKASGLFAAAPFVTALRTYASPAKKKS
jgi:lipid-binding SYLF domain-containing protein